MINNYVNNYKNYETINFLNKFEKFNNIFNIYTKMNINEINIIYKAKEKEIYLFDDSFVSLNKDNCTLIIEGKEQELKSKYILEEINPKKEILLK